MQVGKYTFSEVYYPSSDGKTNIHACIWQPVGEVRAVLQIVHGMAEYAERYKELAMNLAVRGILVCAEDHLGHGRSVCCPENVGYFSDEKGCMPVLRDIRTLTEIVRQKGPKVPYFMFGHSMGSFFCRKYISLYGEELAGAILMGTGRKGKGAIFAGKALCACTGIFRGCHSRPPLIEKLAFLGYNKRFEGRTTFDWLSSVPQNVDAYIADDLCGIAFTCNGFFGLFDIISKACSRKTAAATPDKLPILMVSGTDDPVGDYGKGVIKSYNIYKKYGKNVTLKMFDGCRHELLFDTCSEEVQADIARFIDENIGA